MKIDMALPSEARSQFRRGWPLSVSAVAACVLTLIYCARPDPFAAITTLPAWCWLVLLVPALRFLRYRYRFPAFLCAAAWLVFALMHIEEPKSVLRGLLSPIEPTKPSNAIRLVSFNCAGGKLAALQEIAAWDPDIVFLQESPPHKEVERFAHELFGEQGACVWDVDTSIVLKGNLQPIRPEEIAPFFSLVSATLPDNSKVMLVSLRLLPGTPEVELWDPQCWKSQTRQRLAQLQQIKQLVASLATAEPLIVAGDFNAAQGDKVFSLLPTRLYDSFHAQGRGIGNTIVNDMPLLRIDQIWVSREFETLQSFAVKSRVSDHRMVVTDVSVRR
jgi:endonuclease/exonuclease/phosphatase (EEP) superfamily protein YafD